MGVVKPILYLCGFTGLGALLLYFTETNDEFKKKIQSGKENSNKNQAFINILQGAANDSKPIYLQTPKELEASREKYMSHQK